MKKDDSEKPPVLNSDKLMEIRKDIEKIGGFIVEETGDGLKIDFSKK